MLANSMIQRDDDVLCARSQVVLGVLRVAWWLVWDVVVRGLGWVVGWPLWRALSLGRFPRCSIFDHGAIGAIATLVVHLTGVIVVSVLAWLCWISWR